MHEERNGFVGTSTTKYCHKRKCKSACPDLEPQLRLWRRRINAETPSNPSTSMDRDSDFCSSSIGRVNIEKEKELEEKKKGEKKKIK